MERLVLVADDSPDMCLLLRIYLEGEGYRVATAKNGIEALSKLHSGLRPSLILLDMKMGGMGGEEFIQEFETSLPEIFEKTPIIATSGLAQSPTTKVRSFLQKPIDADTLLREVQRHCNP
jgi:two-component system chemotaxis response regulator CheY